MTIALVLNIVGAAFVIVGVVAPLIWAIRTQFNHPRFSARVPQRGRGPDRRRPSEEARIRVVASVQRRPVHADRPNAQRRTARRGWGPGLPA